MMGEDRRSIPVNRRTTRGIRRIKRKNRRMPPGHPRDSIRLYAK